MIRASAPGSALVQRLQNRAAKIAAELAAERRKTSAARSADWHSAAALWPDFTGETRDGK